MSGQEGAEPGHVRVGCIGLGKMGLPVARRLAEASELRVAGFDADPTRAAYLVEVAPAARAVASLSEIAAWGDVVVTCLPSGEAVRTAYLGPDGLCAALSAGRASIDLSTVAPQIALEIGRAVAEAGGRHVEAPVIGAPEDGARGTLHVLVSADGVATREDLPGPVAKVLARIGEITIAGPPGAASLVKVVQNGLGLVHLVAIAEALGVCAAAGLLPRAFAEIVLAAPGMANSPLFRRVAPAMIDSGLEERSSRLAIAAKDVGLFAAVAEGCGARAPLADIAARIFAEAEAAGLADADFTRVADLFRTHHQEV